MRLALIALALVWGGVAGMLLTRAAYRLSVPPGAAWRAACAAGHPLPAGGPAG
ncbi:prepilin peptidase, partial [Streptomyces fuscigenes]|nr:prepilin peptidase [Streptomyces fuscigenes]